MFSNNELKMKNIIFSIGFCIISITSFSQSKDFINNMTPTYPDCGNKDDRSKCYIVGFSDLIISDLNKSNFSGLDRIQIKLLIRTETDGKSTILRLKSDNSEVERIAHSALTKAPLVEPIKSQNGKNEISSKDFTVVAIWNKKSNKYEMFYKY